MKKGITAVLVVLLATTAMAQKNKKVMLEQIAKLQAHLYQVKQGYNIAKKGLNTVTKWTKGEFDLHKVYLNSLKTVNPNVKDAQKIDACRDLYKEIVNGFTGVLDQSQSSGMFVPQEIQYFRSVYDNLIKNCIETMDNLKMVTSDGQVEMTDDQRMKRIDEYYAQMQENYVFAVAFCTDMQALENARRKHKQEAEQLRVLFGLD